MPATPPIPQSIVNKIKARSQSVRWTVTLKEVRTFSAYCCNIDSDAIMGVAKQPVPIVAITPNPVCLGESIDWDLTDSYAPGSTISAWSIDFGDGNDDSGATIGSAFGSHTYAAVGSYTITVVIEEGTGRNTTMTREVNVVDCSEPPAQYLYIGTHGQGVWFLNRKDGATEWENRSGGLEGDALYINSMAVKPGQSHLSDSQHKMYIATRAGVFYSNNGGRSWEQIELPDPSNLEFADSPAATVAELNFIRVFYDNLDANSVFVVAYKAGS